MGSNVVARGLSCLWSWIDNFLIINHLQGPVIPLIHTEFRETFKKQIMGRTRSHYENI